MERRRELRERLREEARGTESQRPRLEVKPVCTPKRGRGHEMVEAARFVSLDGTLCKHQRRLRSLVRDVVVEFALTSGDSDSDMNL